MAMDFCRLCSEEKDDEDLIEIKDSLIRLKSGIVDFCDIMRDILGIKNLDHLTFICFSCKEQIFNFYNFKLKVKPNLLNEHQLQDDEKVKLVEQVQEFLSERTENMVLIQEQENTLTILPATVYEVTCVPKSDWAASIIEEKLDEEMIEIESDQIESENEVTENEQPTTRQVHPIIIQNIKNFRNYKSLGQISIVNPGSGCSTGGFKRKRDDT